MYANSHCTHGRRPRARLAVLVALLMAMLAGLAALPPTAQSQPVLPRGEDPPPPTAGADERARFPCDDEFGEWLDRIPAREAISMPGHEGTVNAVAVSRDGRFALSGSSDRTAHLWRMPVSGRPPSRLAVLSGHRRWVWAAAFSPSGTRLATGSADTTIRLWTLDENADTGEVTVTAAGIINDHRRGVVALAWVDDGLLFSASQDGTVRAWFVAPTDPAESDGDTLLGINTGQFTAHADALTSMALAFPSWATGSDPGRTRWAGLMLTGSTDNSAKLWRLEILDTPEPGEGYEIEATAVASLEGHRQSVLDVALHPSGRFALTASADSEAKLWRIELDANNAATAVVEVSTLGGHEYWVNACAFNSDGTLALTAAHDGTIKVWRFNAKGRGQVAEAATLRGHRDWVMAARFTPDNRHILSGAADQSVRLWRLNAIARGPLAPRGFWRSPGGDVTAVATLADGGVVIGDVDGRVFVRHVSSGGDGVAIRRLGEHDDTVRAIAISADGLLALTGSDDETAIVWDLRRSAPMVELAGHDDYVTSVALSPRGDLAVTGSDDGTAILWRIDRAAATAEIVERLETHDDAVTAVAFDPLGALIATGSADETVCVWDVQGEAPVLRLTLADAQSTIAALAFDPDDRAIIAGDWSGDLTVWPLLGIDAGGGTDALAVGRVVTIQAHAREITSIVVSGDGAHWLTGSRDATAMVWQLDRAADGDITLSRVRTLTGHAWAVDAVALAAGGKVAITACRDGRVREFEPFSETVVTCGDVRTTWGPSFEQPAGTPAVRVEVQVEPAEGVGSGGEGMMRRAELVITAANTGDAPVHLLLAHAGAAPWLLSGRHIAFGTLAAGERRVRRMLVAWFANADADADGRRVTYSFSDQWGAAPEPVTVTFAE